MTDPQAPTSPGRSVIPPQPCISCRLVGDVPVIVLRHSSSDVTALFNRCPHLSAPLHEGELSEVDRAVCVTCPWHASVFRLRDGGVMHGPATAPGFESRADGGVLQVRT